MADENDTIGDLVTKDEICDSDTWKDRWKNRRRMAWAAFVSMMVVTLLLFYTVPDSKLDKLDDVVIWFYGTMATLILGYMGTTVTAHIFDRRPRG